MKYVKLFFSCRARQFEKRGYEKNAFKVFSSRIRRSNMTWQKNSRLPQFFEFQPKILHAYFWIHMQSNNDEKKISIFVPFTGEAPLKLYKCMKADWWVNTFCTAWIWHQQLIIKVCNIMNIDSIHGLLYSCISFSFFIGFDGL